jgi:hypothetical protein
MSIEKEKASSYYLKNRDEVFQVYGIDPKDRKYNCHHIVTKNDFKTGIVSSDFDIDNKSNLYPIRVDLHVILHQIIEATDNNEDIQPLLARWHEVETNLDKPKPEKLISKSLVKASNKNKIEPNFIPSRLNPRADETIFAEKISNEDANKLTAYRNRYEQAQIKKLSEFQIYYDSA